MTILNILKRPFDFHKTFKILQLKIRFIYVWFTTTMYILFLIQYWGNVMVVWELELQLTMQSKLIITKVVSSNPISWRGILNTILRNTVFSDLQQVSDFLRVLWFPPPINWRSRYNWNIVESGVKHHTPKP